MENILHKNSSISVQKQLSLALIEEVISNNHQPNTKFYTEREIAEKFNTTIITVKLAIKDLIKKEFLYQLPRSGTFIKNNNITYKHEENSLNKHHIICVSFLSRGTAWGDPFHSLITESLEYELEKQGYILEFFNLGNYNKKKYISLFMKIAQNQVGGVLLMGNFHDESITDKIIETGIPAVLINKDEINNKNICNIVIDNINGAFKAVEYLIEMGHKKIAFIGCGLANKPSSLRFEGYKKALQFYNIKIDENLIINNSSQMNSGAGCKNMKILLKKNNKLPTAIFAVTDMMAIGCIPVLKDKGLEIPKDISIIGFNDIEMASHIHPGLTTMHIDRKKMGKTAAKMMINIFQDKKVNGKQVIIDPVLIERESVKRIKKRRKK